MLGALNHLVSHNSTLNVTHWVTSPATLLWIFWMYSTAVERSTSCLASYRANTLLQLYFVFSSSAKQRRQHAKWGGMLLKLSSWSLTIQLQKLWGLKEHSKVQVSVEIFNYLYQENYVWSLIFLIRFVCLKRQQQHIMFPAEDRAPFFPQHKSRREENSYFPTAGIQHGAGRARQSEAVYVWD